MSILVLVVVVPLVALVAWEVGARLRQRAQRGPIGDGMSSVDSEGHYAPELERRRRLDLGAGRWPGPARW